MARTTSFLIDGTEYFAANLTTGGIRVGLKSVKCLDVPACHSLFEKAASISTEAEAESFFDAYVATA